MKLKEKFLGMFGDRTEVTTKQITSWYNEVKQSDVKFTRSSTIFNLIIQPLMVEGIISRKDKGIYLINKDMIPSRPFIVDLDEELDDDLSKYLDEKINKVE